MNLATSSSSYLGLQIHVKPWKLTPIASGCKQSTPVCLFGGKGKSENDTEGSPWKALEKAMSNFRKDPSVEDVLRQQIQKQEFHDGGSGGENTGGGDGSGGSGGGEGSNPGESDDVSISGMLEETLQVILATIGFICLYMLIIDGEEIITFGRDIIKFLFTGRKSIRLGRLIKKWKRIIRENSPVRRTSDPNWLLRAIIRTPTWFDSPRKYARILRRYMDDQEYGLHARSGKRRFSY